MKQLWAIVGFLICSNVSAYTYELPYGMQFDIRGYLGWKQIFSTVDYDSIPSEPELGLSTSLKITDRLNMFNQFKYGTSVNSVFVYNQLAYTPDIPIDSFEVTLKGGKLRYDNTLYNITRINPRTRQGVFQPQSIYWNTLAQTITSGVGVGFDMKYKNWSASYVIDKQTIVNSSKESQAWTTKRMNDFGSKFGGHQMASIEYDVPEQNLRLKSSWNKSKFNISQLDAVKVGTTGITTFGVEYFTAGVEWALDDWTFSWEGQATKRDGVSWTNTQNLAFGNSFTVAYDIDNNFTARINYNRYHSSAKVTLPQQKYNHDLNLGLDWHSGQWMANVEAHWIQGGRIVDANNYNANPEDYKNFYVFGMNLVYFFE